MSIGWVVFGAIVIWSLATRLHGANGIRVILIMTGIVFAAVGILVDASIRLRGRRRRRGGSTDSGLGTSDES
jgi:succinate dehydrogenase/fumarate reductase cytochrome b subunit